MLGHSSGVRPKDWSPMAVAAAGGEKFLRAMNVG